MCVRSCGSSANVSMRSYSAIPNLMTLQGRGFGPFFSGLFPGPSIHRGAFVAPKTCDLQGIASPPFLHVAVEYPSLRSGERYFLSGPDQAAGFGLLLFSGFRRPRSHPLTRSLQSLSDTGSDRCDFEINTGCRLLQMQILCDKSQRIHNKAATDL